MLKYKIDQLRKLVPSVDGSAVPRYLAATPDPYARERVSRVVFSLCHGGNEERIEREIANFGALWRRFAKDFLAQDHIDECNSIKHGFRMASRATSVYVAIQEGPGIPASIEDAEEVGGGQYGGSIFIPKEITRSDGSRFPKVRRGNFTLRHSSLNWDADNLCEDLKLISTSIHNVLTYLMTLNRAPGPPLEYRSRKTEAFKDPLKSSVEIFSFAEDPHVTERDIDPFTREEILAFYHEWRNA